MNWGADMVNAYTQMEQRRMQDEELQQKKDAYARQNQASDATKQLFADPNLAPNADLYTLMSKLAQIPGADMTKAFPMLAGSREMMNKDYKQGLIASTLPYMLDMNNTQDVSRKVAAAQIAGGDAPGVGYYQQNTPQTQHFNVDTGTGTKTVMYDPRNPNGTMRTDYTPKTLIQGANQGDRQTFFSMTGQPGGGVSTQNVASFERHVSPDKQAALAEKLAKAQAAGVTGADFKRYSDLLVAYNKIANSDNPQNAGQLLQVIQAAENEINTRLQKNGGRPINMASQQVAIPPAVMSAIQTIKAQVPEAKEKWARDNGQWIKDALMGAGMSAQDSYNFFMQAIQ